MFKWAFGGQCIAECSAKEVRPRAAGRSSALALAPGPVPIRKKKGLSLRHRGLTQGAQLLRPCLVTCLTPGEGAYADKQARSIVCTWGIGRGDFPSWGLRGQPVQEYSLR